MQRGKLCPVGEEFVSFALYPHTTLSRTDWAPYPQCLQPTSHHTLSSHLQYNFFILTLNG